MMQRNAYLRFIKMKEQKTCNKGRNEITNPSAGRREQYKYIKLMLELRFAMAPVLDT